MNSFNDLNNYAATEITVADLRPAKVVFDRTQPTPQPITISSTTYTQIPTGIEIEEIINYDIANCEITFSIQSETATALTGATLSWSAVPTGITQTTSGQTYTFTGFTKASEWDIIKNPTWNLPSNYATKKPFYVKVDISYFNQAENDIQTESYNVYDPRYYYDARLESRFTVNAVNLKVRFLAATLAYQATLRCSNDVDMFTSFTLSAEAQDVKFGAMSSSMSSTLACTPTLIEAVTNTTVVRSYTANKENQPFLTNTPQITDLRNGTFTVVLTCTNAEFGLTTSSSSASLTLTGTKASINSQIANIYFYPNWNVLTNLSITWTQKYSGTTYTTRTLAVNYAANNTDVKRYTFLTAGAHSFVPTYIEKKYYQISKNLIGGGGDADNFHGGNAGQLYQHTDVTPLTSYSFTVGAKGQRTIYSYSGGSMEALGGTTQTQSTDLISGSTVIFKRGYGGTNSSGGYGTADPDGYTVSLSQTISGSIVRNYRTEQAGSGGKQVEQFGWRLGRGGNGVVLIPSYPVITTSSGTTTYWFITGYNGTTSNNIVNLSLTSGQGGDAPGGTGYPGAVLLYLHRRLNSEGF